MTGQELTEVFIKKITEIDLAFQSAKTGQDALDLSIKNPYDVAAKEFDEVAGKEGIFMKLLELCPISKQKYDALNRLKEEVKRIKNKNILHLRAAGKLRF
jgi:hypothetical protein